MKINQQLIIETKRLLIVPINFQFVSKILNDDITVYMEFDIKPVDDWPNIEIKEIMPIIKEKLSSQSAPDGFGAWLFIDKLENSIIGDGGFKGAPDDNGAIDIGYGIIERKRRQGFAYEAATALIKWGFSNSNVKVITADCLRDNTASLNLLRKMGMVEIRQDDELIYFAMNSCMLKNKVRRTVSS